MRKQLVDLKTVITRLCVRYLKLKELEQQISKLKADLEAATNTQEIEAHNLVLDVRDLSTAAARMRLVPRELVPEPFRAMLDWGPGLIKKIGRKGKTAGTP